MNRDLLVLSNQNYLSPEQVKYELEHLDKILFSVENWQSFSIANEILDINRHKTITKPFLLQKILQDQPKKPFVFICNKN